MRQPSARKSVQALHDRKLRAAPGVWVCFTADMDDVRENELTRPDGRIVAWTEVGSRSGRPVLRIPGTPGSRWSLRADRTPWHERDLWMITTERPGFGRSTRLPGRGFGEHAADLAAILDHLGIDRAHVTGASGGAPHVLAFCARHPTRVSAATVVVGTAPLEDDEIDLMIPHNAQVSRRAARGDRAGVEEILEPVREALMADPIGAFRSLMEHAPEDDQAIMADPAFQAATARGLTEALARGIEGWADEDFAFAHAWEEIDLTAIEASITWYHAAGDRNCPLSATMRLVDQIPAARLVEWPDDVGHLYGYRIESEILDELLARERPLR